MDIINSQIDGGVPFDWGRTSSDYAKYRDIYPPRFYEKIISLGLGIKGQTCLDIGTGTGVIPRNMYKFGASWTGTDISEEQIKKATVLSSGMDIDYRAVKAEDVSFEKDTFDLVTACQCFWYFDHDKLMPEIYDILKPGGSFLVLCMEWLPFEDNVAGESEKLILKYSPKWSGAGETIHPIDIPAVYMDKFTLAFHDEYILDVPFTRETWNGRMKACRGIGASLQPAEIEQWEKEHLELLNRIAPEKFTVKHYAAIAQLVKI